MNTEIISLEDGREIITGLYRPGSTVLVLCDCTNGAIEITLPNVGQTNNNVFEFVKTDSSTNKVTVTGADGQTISGETSIKVVTRYNYAKLVPDGTNWLNLAPNNQGVITVTAAGPTDDLDVAGVGLVLADCTSNSVAIGGLSGGVSGQILRLTAVVGDGSPYYFTLEHNEGGGSQDMFLAAEADMDFYKGQGIVLACDGSDWYSCDYEWY